jgi:hypothetical protein
LLFRHWTRNNIKNQQTNQKQWLRLEKPFRLQKFSAKAKAAVNKMKGAATKATPPSDESKKMKAKKKTAVGEYSEVEPISFSQEPCRQKSGDDDIDWTGTESIMKAAADLSGPAKRKSDAAAMAPKKTNVNKPGPQSDDLTFWIRFSELCKYKAEHGTMSPPPRSKEGTHSILANWIHYIRKRYANNLLSDKYKDSLNGIQFEWTAGQITKKALVAGLPNFWSSRTKNILGDDKKIPQAGLMGKLCQENSHHSVRVRVRVRVQC